MQELWQRLWLKLLKKGENKEIEFSVCYGLKCLSFTRKTWTIRCLEGQLLLIGQQLDSLISKQEMIRIQIGARCPKPKPKLWAPLVLSRTGYQCEVLKVRAKRVGRVKRESSTRSLIRPKSYLILPPQLARSGVSRLFAPN
ncbi:hypothetical protein NE237_020639 [Protea cynaroides]|uniref:Uncharacterized protein n=1 Tax=Protea cynaroides TaxID=273540 RepID=A0A9Q0HBK4_9MAGN|nr:hypothetical protein NE237_020639 [Protea cynaroides]